MNANKIVKVLRVHDTRDYEEVGDKWKPVSGSGEFNICDRCKRLHEVHVYVLLEDGSNAVVGSSCCKQESVEIQSRIASGVSAAQAIKRFELRLAKEKSQLSAFEIAVNKVDALSLPPIENGTCVVKVGYRKGETIETRIIGDASVSLWDGQFDFGDRETLIHHWKENRLSEYGFRYWQGIQFKEAVNHTQRQLDKATTRLQSLSQ